MLKKVILLGAALATVPASQAKINGTMEVHIRPEYVSIENDFNQTGNKDVAKFQSEYNKIYLNGQFNEDLKYHFRYNFNTSGSSSSVTDGTLDRLEYAYLTQKLMDNMNISFGKMWYLFGGREYDYNGLDVYTYSETSGQIPFYEMGAMIDYKIANQTFYIQGSNPNETSSSSTSDTADISNSVGTAFGYYGDFNNGMFKPILSLGIRPFSRQAREDKHYAAGIQFNYGKFQFEYDYLKIDSELDNGVKGDVFSAHVAVFRYNITDKFRPHVKFIRDKKETADVHQYNKWAYDAALEYFPYKTSNYNFHVVYSQVRTDSKVTGTVDSTINTLRFGFKLKHDLFSM